MSPAARKPPARKASARRPNARASVSAAVAEPLPAAPLPAAAPEIATAVDYVVPRPNLLDTGLSDYSFWVSHVDGLTPLPLPPGARTGRIWS